MERAVFVIEPSGERISCALNPNQLVFRRTTGFVPRRSLAGAFTSMQAKDDTLVFTGGAVTELVLDLLFDVSLSGSSSTTEDVAELTQPLWDLAENASYDSGYRAPSRARFIWGKAWNFLAVVSAASQRFENFNTDGVARRSWLRLRLVRVPEIETEDGAGVVPVTVGDPGAQATATDADADTDAAPATDEPVPVSGPDDDGAGDDPPTQRLDVLAFRSGEGPAAWRDIATANGVDDPLSVPLTQPMRLPEATPDPSTRGGTT